MQRFQVVFVVLILLAIPVIRFPQASTPEATPATSLTVFAGCDELDEYFTELADILEVNEGYQQASTYPAGLFMMDATESESVVESLGSLVSELEAIVPPPAASQYHLTLIDITSWYRDLANASDELERQRILNRDRQLLPAISRAILAGQSACGHETRNDAYDSAFGEDD